MTIGELSKVTDISEYTLRYYERKGLIQISRDSGGRRCYAESEMDWILFIKRLKDTGMLLKDIEKYSQLRYEGDSTMQERLFMLQAHRKFVLEEQKKWEEYLKNPDCKIDFYKQRIDFYRTNVLYDDSSFIFYSSKQHQTTPCF